MGVKSLAEIYNSSKFLFVLSGKSLNSVAIQQKWFLAKLQYLFLDFVSIGF